MEQEQGFIDYIEQSIIKNWDRNALTDYKGITLQYKDVARKIAKFHIVLESAGISPVTRLPFADVTVHIGQSLFWRRLPMELSLFPFCMSSRPTISTTSSTIPKPSCCLSATGHGKTSMKRQCPC
mgnify:CR=1 FL=1